MNIVQISHCPQCPPRRQPRCQVPGAQGGIVLIIALIMLVVVSLLAALSVRNATSSEAGNASVRQTQSANQAAETALRYCEDAVINLISTPTVTVTATSSVYLYPSLVATAFNEIHIKDYVAGVPSSVVASNWDGVTATVKLLILPISSVNRSGITTTFSRPPECMVDRLVPSTAPNYSKSFSITARGFGPEVSAADLARSRPIGSEVWMQSSLELN